MKILYPSVILLTAALAFSCSPKVTMQLASEPLGEYNGEVLLLDDSESIPEGSEPIATIDVSSRPFTPVKKGTYDIVLKLARQKVREAGGNVVFIREHQAPNYYSVTHSIKGDVYKLPETAICAETTVSSHPEYASVWIYRYPLLDEFEYNVNIDNKWVFWSAPKTMTEVRFYESGKHTVWAYGGRRISVDLDIEIGKDYYIETSFQEGFHLDHMPYLFEVSAFAGRAACKTMELIEQK